MLLQHTRHITHAPCALNLNLHRTSTTWWMSTWTRCCTRTACATRARSRRKAGTMRSRTPRCVTCARARAAACLWCVRLAHAARPSYKPAGRCATAGMRAVSAHAIVEAARDTAINLPSACLVILGCLPASGGRVCCSRMQMGLVVCVACGACSARTCGRRVVVLGDTVLQEMQEWCFLPGHHTSASKGGFSFWLVIGLRLGKTKSYLPCAGAADVQGRGVQRDEGRVLVARLHEPAPHAAGHVPGQHLLGGLRRRPRGHSQPEL